MPIDVCVKWITLRTVITEFTGLIDPDENVYDRGSLNVNLAAAVQRTLNEGVRVVYQRKDLMALHTRHVPYLEM